MFLTENASYTCAAVSTGRQWHHYVGQANPYLYTVVKRRLLKDQKLVDCTLI